ncbi:MAG TPA: IS1182 family transposase [Spirochaetia bacterium]|nr:IS1182 family transposase [Spirochaetia bacterium]
MRSFIEPNRKQKLLLTEIDLDSVAPIGSALRYIDELVEMFDTGAIEETYDLDSEQGRNPIHPKTFIKLGLYALYNCRFSLRKIQEDIENHLGYKWLTGDRAIDHSTIGKFFAKYIDQIVELFSQVVTICKQQGLIDFDILAIDSMKLRANASHKQSKTLESIEKEEDRIKKRLRELIKAATDDSIQQEEEKALAGRLERLEEAKAVLKQRIEEKEAVKSGRELKRTEKINITDFDAHIMQQANREQNPAYSVTTATDTANDIITHFQVNPQDDDEAALLGSVEGSRESSGTKHKTVDADSGFASKENYESLEQEGQEALIPDRRLEAEGRREVSRGEYDRSKFIYDESANVYICPQSKILRKMGEATIKGRRYHRYGNASACRHCELRDKCTNGKFRTIYRDQNEEVQELMRARLERVENRSRYNKRAHAAESPYGHAKRNLKFTHVMRRGIEKVRMEMAMLFMLHNIMKVAPVRIGSLP